jgi:hypothetical protein
MGFFYYFMVASFSGHYIKVIAMSNTNQNQNPETSTEESKVATPICEMTLEQLKEIMPCKGYSYINKDNKEMFIRWFELNDLNTPQINALSDKQMCDIYDDEKGMLLRTVKRMRAMDIRTRPATLDRLQIEAVRSAVSADSIAQGMADSIIKAVLSANEKAVSSEDVRRIVREEMPLRQSQGTKAKPQVIEIRQPERDPVLIEGLVHKEFSHVLKMCPVENVMLVGGAGSGKTTIARQVAKALSLPFYFTGAVQHEAKLLGFINPHGKYVETSFYRAWTQGGIFLMDEMDASDPQALLAINASLDCNLCDFPCGVVEKHKDFHFIGASNTFGKGATMDYIGRNVQDEAGRSRWYYIGIDYDEAMEESLALSFAPASIALGWCKYVRAVRKAVENLCERHVVSPRTTIKGVKALSLGIDRDKVENAVLWHGMDDERKKRVLEEAKKICGGLLP